MVLRERIQLLALFLTLVACTACGSGGGPVLPVITSVTPSGTVGAEGASVSFAVIASTVGTVTYGWDFDNGAAPNTSSVASPTVTLRVAGTYDGVVTVTDDNGSTHANFAFTVSAVIPVITQVVTTPGLPAGPMQFTATVSGHPTGWAWTWDDGVEPLTSSDTEPEVMCLNPGSYTGRVVASNGAGDSDPFPFAFTVGEPVVPSWTIMNLGATVTGSGGVASVCVHDGRLAVLRYAPEGVVFSRARVAFPTTDSDWDSHLIKAGGRTLGIQSLVTTDGRLAAVYLANLDNPRKLHFALSNGTEPAGPSDWSSYELTGSGEISSYSLLVLSDHLVLVTPGGRMRCFQSSSLTPSSIGDWSAHFVEATDQVNDSGTVHLLDGKLFFPAIESREDGASILHVARATELVPDGPEDWELTPIRALGTYFADPPFAVVYRDRPVLTYTVDRVGGQQLFVAFSDATAAPYDFQEINITPPGIEARNPAITLTTNRLLIAYYDARKRDGWNAKQLTPLLAGLDQLLPWIHQWHPEIDKEFGET
ncbi:MAG: PKD domain-containing protein, partial [bacterium]